MPTGEWHEERVLITVKTYPNPSATYGETVCTAGIRQSGGFIRLYPVRFRLLAEDKRFAKYTWIRVPVKKADRDSRPESYRLDDANIEREATIDTKDGWQERKEIVLPLLSPSVEALKARHEKDGTSLGIIKPKKIVDFSIVPADSPSWTEKELTNLRKEDLFAGAPPWVLEKIPVEFRYKFYCDDDNCDGHDMRLLDWEVAQSYRSWRLRYRDPDELSKKILQRYRDEIIEKYDTHFYLGTIANHPKSWTIIGLFYPPKAKAGA
ncbi:MAG: hypothetical protein M1389_04175 [Chloroflexi bacterium]|nr:hypothetical protein [Chloroflexota bacterium]